MDFDEELIPLQLHCYECENTECKLPPFVVDEEDKSGCVRQAEEDVVAEYIHFRDEVIPFLKQYDEKHRTEFYFEFYDFLYNHIYNLPISGRISKEGRIINGTV